MSSRPLHCAECNTLLYLPVPDAGPVDFDNPNYLTAEQMIIMGIACSLATCTSHLQDPFELVAEQPLEQPGYVLTVDPSMNMGGQQPPLSENQPLPPQQQPPPPQEQQLLGNVPMENTNGMTVHTGPNPCRSCFQSGGHCSIDPNEDNCSQCRNRVHPRLCTKSLFGAIPGGHWRRKIVYDYAPPFSVEAAGYRAIPDGSFTFQYLVKWVTNKSKGWEPVENLNEYPWILKMFHLANPEFPGPPDSIVDGDEEFLQLLATARAQGLVGTELVGF